MMKEDTLIRRGSQSLYNSEGLQDMSPVRPPHMSKKRVLSPLNGRTKSHHIQPLQSCPSSPLSPHRSSPTDSSSSWSNNMSLGEVNMIRRSSSNVLNPRRNSSRGSSDSRIEELLSPDCRLDMRRGLLLRPVTGTRDGRSHSIVGLENELSIKLGFHKWDFLNLPLGTSAKDSLASVEGGNSSVVSQKDDGEEEEDGASSSEYVPNTSNNDTTVEQPLPFRLSNGFVPSTNGSVAGSGETHARSETMMLTMLPPPSSEIPVDAMPTTPATKVDTKLCFTSLTCGEGNITVGSPLKITLPPAAVSINSSRIAIHQGDSKNSSSKLGESVERMSMPRTARSTPSPVVVVSCAPPSYPTRASWGGVRAGDPVPPAVQTNYRGVGGGNSMWSHTTTEGGFGGTRTTDVGSRSGSNSSRSGGGGDSGWVQEGGGGGGRSTTTATGVYHGDGSVAYAER